MLLTKILTIGFLLGATISAYIGIKLIISFMRYTEKAQEIKKDTDNIIQIEPERFDDILEQLDQLRRNNDINVTSNLNEDASSIPEEPSIIKPKLTVVK